MTSTATHPVRINEHLQQYWQELRGDRPLPLESEVSAEALKEVWSSCFLINVRDKGFFYDYLGQDLLAAYGDNFTGREITEALVYPHPEPLFETFKKVVASAAPGIDESEFTNSQGTLIKYRSCVLPLGAHGRPGVAFLLGGMKWKAY